MIRVLIEASGLYDRLSRVRSSSKYLRLLSVDGGTGTLKFMLRVLLEGDPAHSMRSILVLSEAYGVKETFKDLQFCFSAYKEEISRISMNGIRLASRWARSPVAL